MIDTLKLARKLEDARFSREQAEAIAEAFADATTGTLASKADLDLSTNTLREAMRALETTLREAMAAFHWRVIAGVAVMLLVHLMAVWGIVAANVP